MGRLMKIKTLLVIIMLGVCTSCKYLIPWALDKDGYPDILLLDDVYLDEFSNSIQIMEKAGKGYTVHPICDSIDSIYYNYNRNDKIMYGYSKEKGYFCMGTSKNIKQIKKPLKIELIPVDKFKKDNADKELK